MGKVFNNPQKYLSAPDLPSGRSTGLGDGIYRGPACIDQRVPLMCTPWNLAGVCDPRVTPRVRKGRRAWNRRQRRLRVVVEQTFGIIKQWKVVGNVVWRMDYELQGKNFLLATLLTARLMRVRNSYPRGEKWLKREGDDE